MNAHVISTIYQRITWFAHTHPRSFAALFSGGFYTLLLLLLPFWHTYESNHFTLYARAAESLVAGHGLGDFRYIAPGWPIAIAALLPFFSPIMSVGILNVLSVMGIVLGTYCLGALVWTRRVGLVAATIATLWPLFLGQAFEFGSSILFYTALFTWGIYFLLYAYIHRRLLFACLSGTIFGFAALVDVIGLYVPLVSFIAIVCGVVVYQKQWRISRKELFVGVLAVVCAVVVIAPWTYRNTLVFESPRHAPVITKVIEQEIWWEKSLQQKLLMRYQEEGVLLLTTSFVKMFAVPYNLSTFDHYTTVSYKAVLSEGVGMLSAHQRFILVLKLGVTLLYLLICALALYAFVRHTPRYVQLLFLFLLGYVYVAVTVVGSTALVAFSNISPPASFFFPFLPLVLVLASVSLVRLTSRV